jgi:hypothetical protein
MSYERLLEKASLKGLPDHDRLDVLARIVDDCAGASRVLRLSVDSNEAESDKEWDVCIRSHARLMTAFLDVVARELYDFAWERHEEPLLPEPAAGAALEGEGA